AHAHGVLAARAVPPEPAAGADALGHLRACVGLRLRLRLELARCLHRLPAAQDGNGRRAAADPHRARRRLRAAREMSFRARLTLVAAAAVALAVVAASVAGYFVVRNTLYAQVDNRLENRAEEITSGPGLQLEQRPGGNTYVHIPREILGSEGYIQIVRADGEMFRTF